MIILLCLIILVSIIGLAVWFFRRLYEKAYSRQKYENTVTKEDNNNPIRDL